MEKKIWRKYIYIHVLSAHFPRLLRALIGALNISLKIDLSFLFINISVDKKWNKILIHVIHATYKRTYTWHVCANYSRVIVV